MNWRKVRSGNKKGFTIAEAVIASGILAIVMLASLSLISMHKMQKVKSKELSIMQAFATQYIEILRANRYNSIRYDMPINALYNGTNGAPTIKTPPDGNTWVPMDTDAYKTFNPELAWFVNLDTKKTSKPEYRLQITETLPSSSLSNIAKKHIQMEIRWDSPIKRTGKQSFRFDTMVYNQYR